MCRLCGRRAISRYRIDPMMCRKRMTKNHSTFSPVGMLEARQSIIVQSQKTDSPFATPAGARDAAKTARRAADESVTIILRGGVYFLSEPLTFTPQDSGTPEHPVKWCAEKGEQPTLSGGRLLTDVHAVTVN